MCAWILLNRRLEAPLVLLLAPAGAGSRRSARESVRDRSSLAVNAAILRLFRPEKEDSSDTTIRMRLLAKRQVGEDRVDVFLNRSRGRVSASAIAALLLASK